MNNPHHLKLYWKFESQRSDVAEWLHWANKYPAGTFFQPDVWRAPWHVQARIKGHLIDFYPHKAKMVLFADDPQVKVEVIEGVPQMISRLAGLAEDNDDVLDEGDKF